MNKRSINHFIILKLLLGAALSAGSGHAAAAIVSVDSAGASHSNVGDFLSVSSYTGSSSSQGAIEQVWSSNRSSISGDFSISSIISFLEGNNVSASPGLVFGFSANERNNSPELTITSINLGFEKEDGSLVSFSLGDNQINISDFHSGNSHAEAQLQIDLGFDMMQEWSNTTSKKMSYSFNISNGSNGPEKFFISNVFTSAPPVNYITSMSTIPLPAPAWLFGSALAGLLMARRTQR